MLIRAKSAFHFVLITKYHGDKNKQDEMGGKVVFCPGTATVHCAVQSCGTWNDGCILGIARIAYCTQAQLLSRPTPSVAPSPHPPYMSILFDLYFNGSIYFFLLLCLPLPHCAASVSFVFHSHFSLICVSFHPISPLPIYVCSNMFSYTSLASAVFFTSRQYQNVVELWKNATKQLALEHSYRACGYMNGLLGSLGWETK